MGKQGVMYRLQGCGEGERCAMYDYWPWGFRLSIYASGTLCGKYDILVLSSQLILLVDIHGYIYNNFAIPLGFTCHTLPDVCEHEGKSHVMHSRLS